MNWQSYLLLSSGLLALLLTSSFVVRSTLKKVSHKSIEALAAEDTPTEIVQKRRIAIGSIIGKCENILVFIFLMLDAYTALAVVVTAKTIVRKEEIEKNSMFFLAGTLINVSYSVLLGFIAKLLLAECKKW
jgi:hypothetical protein